MLSISPDQQRRLKQLRPLSSYPRQRLLYNWAKQGVISLIDMRELEHVLSINP